MFLSSRISTLQEHSSIMEHKAANSRQLLLMFCISQCLSDEIFQIFQDYIVLGITRHPESEENKISSFCRIICYSQSERLSKILSTILQMVIHRLPYNSTVSFLWALDCADELQSGYWNCFPRWIKMRSGETTNSFGFCVFDFQASRS